MLYTAILKVFMITPEILETHFHFGNTFGVSSVEEFGQFVWGHNNISAMFGSIKNNQKYSTSISSQYSTTTTQNDAFNVVRSESIKELISLVEEEPFEIVKKTFEDQNLIDEIVLKKIHDHFSKISSPPREIASKCKEITDNISSNWVEYEKMFNKKKISHNVVLQSMLKHFENTNTPNNISNEIPALIETPAIEYSRMKTRKKNLNKMLQNTKDAVYFLEFLKKIPHIKKFLKTKKNITIFIPDLETISKDSYQCYQTKLFTPKFNIKDYIVNNKIEREDIISDAGDSYNKFKTLNGNGVTVGNQKITINTKDIKANIDKIIEASNGNIIFISELIPETMTSDELTIDQQSYIKGKTYQNDIPNLIPIKNIYLDKKTEMPKLLVESNTIKRKMPKLEKVFVSDNVQKLIVSKSSRDTIKNNKVPPPLFNIKDIHISLSSNRKNMPKLEKVFASNNVQKLKISKLIPIDTKNASKSSRDTINIKGTTMSNGFDYDEDTIFSFMETAKYLSTLVKLVKTAMLNKTLDDSEQNLTIFAPTNNAFISLEQKYPGVTDILTKDTNTLKRVLLYHVLPGNIPYKDLLTTKSFTTLDKTDVMVDEKTIIREGIDVKNGVVHIIDTVLLPEDIRKSLLINGKNMPKLEKVFTNDNAQKLKISKLIPIDTKNIAKSSRDTVKNNKVPPLVNIKGIFDDIKMPTLMPVKHISFDKTKTVNTNLHPPPPSLIRIDKEKKSPSILKRNDARIKISNLMLAEQGEKKTNIGFSLTPLVRINNHLDQDKSKNSNIVQFSINSKKICLDNDDDHTTMPSIALNLLKNYFDKHRNKISGENHLIFFAPSNNVLKKIKGGSELISKEFTTGHAKFVEAHLCENHFPGKSPNNVGYKVCHLDEFVLFKGTEIMSPVKNKNVKYIKNVNLGGTMIDVYEHESVFNFRKK